jgi:protein gp37
MAKKSSIEWCDSTVNPMYGCTAISPACDNCYAARQAPRLGALTVGLVKNGHWNGKLNMLPKRMDEVMHWKKPRRIFVGSMTDLFHGAVQTPFLDHIFEVMAAAQQHTFLVLTKRPTMAKSYFRSKTPAWLRRFPHLWLGVTAENQSMLDLRVPVLMNTPVAHRFVSMEPLLGAVDMHPYLGFPGSLDWVICGGESGPKARPTHPRWVYGVRDQCAASNTPFMFKQWGAWGTKYVYIPNGEPVFLECDSYHDWQVKSRFWGEKGVCYISVDGTRCRTNKDFMECKYPVAIMHPMGKQDSGRLVQGKEHMDIPQSNKEQTP